MIQFGKYKVIKYVVSNNSKVMEGNSFFTSFPYEWSDSYNKFSTYKLIARFRESSSTCFYF